MRFTLEAHFPFLFIGVPLPTRFKVTIGIVGTLLVVAIAGFFFLRFQLHKSFPETSGSITVAGLHAAVDVVRDEYGVPSITARDEHDLMFTVGYVHAQDRLWQMDMGRRIGQGRLSELFGDITLPFDKMFRIIGIRRISEEVERSITPESRTRLQAYADGVNAFIATHQGKYPVEFDLLRYEPEPWTPLHSIMIARLMAWELNLSWWTDLTLGAIVERVGYEKAREIFPTYPPDVAPTVPASEWQKTISAALEFMHTSQDYCEFRGIGGTLGGSNAWAVAPKKSESDHTILANDTHLQLTTPSKWYEMSLRSPDYSVMGFSVPGIPGIVAGNNEHLAWGLTNVMADDADFYVERLDSADATRYIYDGQLLPITSREEEIAVRDDTTHYVTIRSTHHGPIVTDIKTMLKKAEYPFVASMRWTGAEMSDQIDAFNRINKATNWDEFTAGVKFFSGPGQNFVYADVNGNIGYWCGVMLPIRSSMNNTTLPLAGWEKLNEWQGFVAFEKLPHLFNPPEGFIATANNRIVDDAYPYHISDLWEPPSRVQRLRDVLSHDLKFSVHDFELLQNDQFSLYAEEMTPYIIAACRGNLDPPFGNWAIEYLTSWNFVFSSDDIATAIYQQFLAHLVRNIYEDEMGEKLFHDYVMLVNVPLRVTLRLVQEDNSSWFDDIRTSEGETRDAIIVKSMKQAIVALRTQLGDETRHWQWGSLHTVTLQHPFGLQKPLDKVFSIGPYPYGGASTAMTSGEYSFNDIFQPTDVAKPFGVTVGASFRRIVDMAKPGVARTILPSGQSGQVFSKHYHDQTPLWLNGAYKTVRADGNLQSAHRLTLQPAQ
ncbi:MAG: penicillin acylase family protein [Ignavibacteriae bacterium]|nr:penicillin acylase family protein [Ignavibacteriota bacterium]